MNNQVKGTLSLLAATAIWGTAFIAQSVGMDHVGPMTFQACRCALAVVFLVALSFFWEALQGDVSGWVQRWKNPALWKSGIICGCALFVAGGLQQVGLVYTDAGKAGFITAMYIVMVPILRIFIGQKPQLQAIISVGIAVVGLYLLSCVGVSSVNIGDVLLMGCAVAFGVQILFVDKFAPALDGLRLNCVQALVASVLSAPFALATETISMHTISAAAFPIAYAGIASMGIAYSLQIVGQKHVEPTAASLLMSLESVFAALSGWLLLQERMNGFELCGCALVFAAVILSQIPLGKKEAV